MNSPYGFMLLFALSFSSVTFTAQLTQPTDSDWVIIEPEDTSDTFEEVHPLDHLANHKNTKPDNFLAHHFSEKKQCHETQFSQTSLLAISQSLNQSFCSGEKQ